MKLTGHRDYETRSRADIAEVGAFRYAEDPSTEIFCAAVAMGNDEPLIWVNPKFCFDDVQSDPWVDENIKKQRHPDTLVYAHNSQFEASISINKGEPHGLQVSLHQWRCTAAMARRANIPASLEKAAATLGIAQQKDTRGKSLIRKFSIPRKDGTFLEPWEAPEDFKAFLNYCKQDVRVEQQIHKELSAFELTGPVLDTFLFDLEMNSRGLPVNVEALRHAQHLIDETEARLSKEFTELTGFNHTQRNVFLTWLKENGYKGDTLRAADMAEEMADDEFDPESVAGRALTIRKMLSYASIKKVRSMLACASDDGRVRGTIQFYGAQTTGRSAGRLVQPQNFKRPTIKNTKIAYSMICNGEAAQWMQWCFGVPVLEVISSSIRHFIHDTAGPMYDVDYSAIEARIVNWLAGQEDAIEEYRNKIDRYKRMASAIYGVPVSEVNDFPQRFVGKQATLGCGFGMGPPKFRMTCQNYGYTLPWRVINQFTGQVVKEYTNEDEADKDCWALNKPGKDAGTHRVLEYVVEGLEVPAVKAFRETHPMVVKYWYAMDRAAKAAIRAPGEKFHVRTVSLFCNRTAGAKYLFIQLPSGRRLAYRDPQIKTYQVEKKDKDGRAIRNELGEIQYRTDERISYHGQVEGKAMWGRVDTFGAKLVENCVQAVAADVMNNGAVNAERAGFKVATLIHDQCLVYGGDPAKLPELCKCLTTLPPWGAGLPVDVDGKVVPFYTK